MLDTLISRQNLEMLDKHADTLERIGDLLGKVEKITNSPVLQQIGQIVLEKSQTQPATDPWNCMIANSASPQPIVVQQNVPSSPPPPPQSKSELHRSMHNAIDEMTEQDLEAFITPKTKKDDENKSKSAADTNPEHNPKNN